MRRETRKRKKWERSNDHNYFFKKRKAKTNDIFIVQI